MSAAGIAFVLALIALPSADEPQDPKAELEKLKKANEDLVVKYNRAVQEILKLKGDAAKADKEGDIKDLKLRDWEPRPMLKVKETVVERPMFPVIDVHNHLRNVKDVAAMVATMDAAGIKTVVHLDGGWGDALKANLAKLDEAYPGRFLTYALLDFDGIDDADWGERAAAQLEQGFRMGAKGSRSTRAWASGSATRTAASCRSTTPSSTLCGAPARSGGGWSRSTWPIRRPSSHPSTASASGGTS
jgi:hypothetical protein